MSKKYIVHSWVAIILYVILTLMTSFTAGVYSYKCGLRIGFTEGAQWMICVMSKLRRGY